MLNMFSLKDKVALITGGNGGIGWELLEGFYGAGATVASFDKIFPKKLPSFVECYNVDITDSDALHAAFIKFWEDFGRIDILVNCAGVTCPFSGTLYPKNLWRKTLDVNLNACYELCELVGMRMISQGVGGSIINITSINAAVVMPDNPAYAAAKAGLRHLSKALAMDWGKHNIRVNNLGPGYTKTKMNVKSLHDSKLYEQRCKGNMLGRWAEPKEMIGPAIFLASDASSYVTGSDLWVDGGWISKGM